VRCSAVYTWTPNVATRGVLTHLENTKSHFRPGLCPGPRWGSSRRSLRPLSRLGRGIPPSHSPPPRRLRRLDFRRLRRLATRRLRRLGSDAFGASIPCAPLPLSSAPPNDRILLATRLSRLQASSDLAASKLFDVATNIQLLGC